MTTYILHVSLLLGLGFVLYQVLLKKETFYSLNRIILSSYLVLAFSLPLIHIPQDWSLKNVNPIASKIGKIDQNNSIPKSPNIDSDQSKDIVDAEIIDAKNETIVNTLPELPVEKIGDKQSTESLTPTLQKTIKNTTSSINWLGTLKWIYIIGLVIFLINFIVQFSILIFYRLKFPTLKDGKLTIVEMEGDKAPFSFLNMIYINPSKYDYGTYEQIIAHEKIHITKWHSLDIFLSEFALIVLWFNPFAWFYRKAVEHNLEYLTDQEMLASGANAEAYQMNLLKVSVPELPLSLSTNYNQSFLKKRIHMMNAKKSSASSTWKYLFILPILGLTVSLFNPTILAAQNTDEQVVNQVQNYDQENHNEVENGSEKVSEKAIHNEILSLDNNKIELIDSKKHVGNSTNPITDLSMLNLDPNLNLSVSQTNSGYSIISDDGQMITINNASGKTSVTNTQEDLEDKGVWEAELKNNTVCLFIKKGGIGKNYYWSSSECFLSSDFTPVIRNNTEGEFSMTRGPGTLKLKGEFSNNEGTGRYTFTPNTNFISIARNEGYTISENKLIHFFLSGVEESFFKFLKSNGYTKIDEDELLALAIHDVNEDYIMDINGEFKKANYEQPSIDELIALKIHDVDMDYIKSFGKELYEDLTADQIIAAAIHDVDPKFIAEFKALGYIDLTFDNLIAAAIHDVDIDYVKELKSAGFDDLSFDNLIAASIHNVNPDYIKKFKNAGFKNLSFDDMITASIHDVDPEYITTFQDAGMDLDFDDMVSAAIHNIDVSYIKEFQDAGMSDLTFDNVVAAGIHNVDVDYLKEAKSYGFDLTFDQLIASSIHNVDLKYLDAFSKAGIEGLDFDDMVTASIHNVDPGFIKDFNALGYSDLTFDNVISAAIHNVDIDFIRGFKEAGFTDVSFDDFISAAIHNVRPEFVKEVKAAGLEDISFDDIISFGIHNIDVDDIKGLSDMGFDLDADKMIEAGIHNVTPKFIKKMQDKGHKNLTFDEYVKLKIHGF